MHQDGREVWHRSIRAPLFDEERKVAGIIGIREDITARKLAEDKLKESGGGLRRAEMIARMGHYALDKDGGNAVWSDGFKAMWGFALDSDPQFDEVVARLHPEDSEWVMKEFGKISRSARRLT